MQGWERKLFAIEAAWDRWRLAGMDLSRFHWVTVI
jgi:hypothetical protein